MIKRTLVSLNAWIILKVFLKALGVCVCGGGDAGWVIRSLFWIDRRDIVKGRCTSSITTMPRIFLLAECGLSEFNSHSVRLETSRHSCNRA
jgi:hypothetical protein